MIWSAEAGPKIGRVVEVFIFNHLLLFFLFFFRSNAAAAVHRPSSTTTSSHHFTARRRHLQHPVHGRAGRGQQPGRRGPALVRAAAGVVEAGDEVRDAPLGEALPGGALVELGDDSLRRGVVGWLVGSVVVGFTGGKRKRERERVAVEEK